MCRLISRTSLALTLTLAWCSSLPLAYSQQIDLKKLLKNGGVRVELEDGTPLLTYRDQESFIPASTLKLATTFCALESMGGEYRFITNFYRGKDNTLYIKGSGDPSLVSEELSIIASKLAPLFPVIESIVIDPSFFDPNISIDGSSSSLNPYDSKNAAFVGNFSSAHLVRRKSGMIETAEAQTPLTPLSKHAGEKLRRGASERINLGTNWRTGTIYGGELLAAFLRRSGASGPINIRIDRTPSDAKRIYEHRSSQNLEEISKGLLKYSTNFTTNQIFLVLGANTFGAPATVEKAQRVMRECMEKKVGWTDFHIEEGAGLSRRNRVSPAQMTQLLKRFEPYQHLLNVEDDFAAKTGSLRGVNSLAGYFDLSPRKQVRFAILINSDVEHLYKYKVARAIRDYLKKAEN
jgi:D-alanyl-D-alanine carboxypeptidase/D-alanyl-D-alanine-endopeptidase (penicillin-binding protein 4)